MEPGKRIEELVRRCYWELDLNCARTTLTALSELFSFPLHPQVHEAATGMQGAGLYRAQCGLVEGTLMFIGVFFASRGVGAAGVTDICRSFAAAFDKEFGSLQCAALRPGGFSPDDEEHLCAPLSLRAITFSHTFIKSELNAPVSR